MMTAVFDRLSAEDKAFLLRLSYCVEYIYDTSLSAYTCLKSVLERNPSLVFTCIDCLSVRTTVDRYAYQLVLEGTPVRFAVRDTILSEMLVTEQIKVDNLMFNYERGDTALLLPGELLNLEIVPTYRHSEKQETVKQVIEEYTALCKKKAAVLGIPYEPDVFNVLENGDVRLVKATVVNGVYYMPDFVTECGMPVYDRMGSFVSNSCFKDYKGTTLKVIGNPPRLYSLSSLFSDCNWLTVLDLSEFVISDVYSLSHFCDYCNNLKEIRLGTCDLSKCINLSSAFSNCSCLKEIPVSDWDVSNVLNMFGTFSYCRALERIDLSKWNIDKVETISMLFDSAVNLKETGMENWDVSKIKDVSYTFSECKALETSLAGWRLQYIIEKYILMRYAETGNDYCSSVASFVRGTAITEETLWGIFDGNKTLMLSAQS